MGGGKAISGKSATYKGGTAGGKYGGMRSRPRTTRR